MGKSENEYYFFEKSPIIMELNCVFPEIFGAVWIYYLLNVFWMLNPNLKFANQMLVTLPGKKCEILKNPIFWCSLITARELSICPKLLSN